MRKVLIKRNSGGPIGVDPTPQQKLINTAKKMGVPGIAKQQGSSVNIYDTVSFSTGANRQTLEFFTQTANKSKTFTNFQSGVFQAGESLIVEDITIIALTVSGALTSDATVISTAQSLQGLLLAGLNFCDINLTIGNDTVMKDYLAVETHPEFNPANLGITEVTAGNTIVGASVVRLKANPSILPNIRIKLSLEFPATGVVPAGAAIMCVLGRTGSLFSSKTTN